MKLMLHFLLIPYFIFGDLTSPIFINRHSGKSYNPEKVISEEQIFTLIDAARWAPSSHNDQPWHFIICDKFLTPESYAKALSSLTERQQGWAVNAQLLIIAVARVQKLETGEHNEWGEYDMGAASLSIALQASDLGLMVHQIGGFNHDKISSEFLIPAGFKPMAILVTGYEVDNPPPRNRIRNPIENHFFLGEWGNGIKKKDEG